MRSSLIVVREPKQQMPEAFRKKVLETYSTAFGFASPQANDHVDWRVFTNDEDDLTHNLAEIERVYKDERVFYHFTQADEESGLTFESCQPFELLTNEKEGDELKVLMVAMLEGEFDIKWQGLERDGFTAEFFLSNHFLSSKIAELYELSDKSLPRLNQLLEKQVTKDDIAKNLGPKASILLIPANGAATAYANNKDTGKWSWGFASNPLGFPSDAPAAEAPAPKKGYTKLGDIARAAATTAASTPAGGSVIKPEELYAPVLKNPTFSISKGKLWCLPPKGSNWKQAKTWWNTHCTLVRPDDPNLVYSGFDFDNLRAGSTLRELKARLAGEEQKPKEAEHEQGPAKPGTEPLKEKEPSEMSLLIPTAQKAKYSELKLMVVDRDTLKKRNEDYPRASEQLGEDNLDKLLSYAPEGYIRLVHDTPRLAICLLHEFRCQLLGLYDTKAPAKEAPVVVEKTETPPKKLSMREAAMQRQKVA